MRLFTLLALVWMSSQCIQGKGQIKVKFLHFKNEFGYCADNRCCDYENDECVKSDPKFFICLADSYPTLACNYHHSESQVFNKTNEIYMDTTFAGKNPIILDIDEWPVSFNIHVIVNDVDEGEKTNDLIDTLNKTIELWGSYSKEFKMEGTNSHLDVIVDTECQQYLHGGKCDVYCKKGETFTCDDDGSKICEPNWSGSNCDVEGPCLKNPCLNGGQCEEEIDGFSCTCELEWTGETCDEDVDECLKYENICNHGDCENEIGGFYCYCNEGYEGDYCAEQTNDCLNEPCNNGHCLNLDTPGKFLCVCNVGYTGDFCDEDIDECANSTCKNGASCTNTVGSFSCDCPEGWHGVTCEDDVNECDSMTCQNGGMCLNTAGGFHCSCGDDYQVYLSCAFGIDATKRTSRDSDVINAEFCVTASTFDKRLHDLIKSSNEFGEVPIQVSHDEKRWRTCEGQIVTFVRPKVKVNGTTLCDQITRTFLDNVNSSQLLTVCPVYTGGQVFGAWVDEDDDSFHWYPYVIAFCLLIIIVMIVVVVVIIILQRRKRKDYDLKAAEKKAKRSETVA